MVSDKKNKRKRKRKMKGHLTPIPESGIITPSVNLEADDSMGYSPTKREKDDQFCL